MAKTPRTTSTYRGARRNYAREFGSGWTRFWRNGKYWFSTFKASSIRHPYSSSRASKYMPHDNGGAWHKTPKKMLFGMPHPMKRGFNGRNH